MNSQILLSLEGGYERKNAYEGYRGSRVTNILFPDCLFSEMGSLFS